MVVKKESKTILKEVVIKKSDFVLEEENKKEQLPIKKNEKESSDKYNEK